MEQNNGWRGCKNVQMIWHGEWGDPELEAEGYTANYWDIENSMWYEFLEETGHTDSESDVPEVEEEFNQWLQKHESDIISDICNCGFPTYSKLYDICMDIISDLVENGEINIDDDNYYEIEQKLMENIPGFNEYSASEKTKCKDAMGDAWCDYEQ